MQQSTSALFNRPDTLFGVCEGLGQDFGFNPLYLRVALSVGLLWSPIAMFSIYAALGVVVALSRLIFRAPKSAVRQAAEQRAAQQADEAIAWENDENVGLVAKAA